MRPGLRTVSVLYREPKLLKAVAPVPEQQAAQAVSVLYREPKLLKERELEKDQRQQ